MTLTVLETPGGPNEALLLTPSTGAGPWPGVVIVHDIAGFTDDAWQRVFAFFGEHLKAP